RPLMFYFLNTNIRRRSKPLSRRSLYIAAVLIAFALAVSGLVFGTNPTTQAQAPFAVSGPKVPLPDVLRDLPQDMKVNHGKYDNALTALYERWLAGEDISGKNTSKNAPVKSKVSGVFSPLYGPDVRMSNPSFSGTQNEFQIDVNASNSANAIGTSNDGRSAGV